LAEEREEYDLKASAKLVGPLYPVLIDAEGNCIDGYHRMMADPEWPIQRLEHVKTREQLLMARLVANLHRRKVPAEEKTQMLADLAEETGWSPKQIAEKLVMSHEWVLKYIPDRFKDRDMQQIGALGGRPPALRRKATSIAENIAKVSGVLGPFAQSCELSEKDGYIVVEIKTPLRSEQLLELRGKLVPFGGQYRPAEGQFIIPPSRKPRKEEPRIKIVLDPDADDRDRFLDDLDMWFIDPGEPIMQALVQYCYDKEMYWEDAVRHLLTKALKEEGYGSHF
jgi:hypothetical protein